MTKSSKKRPKKSDFLTRVQVEAINSLLSGQSIRAVANNADVSERTVYRWLKNPEFAKTLREQRQAAFTGVISRIFGTMDISVSILQRGLQDGELKDKIAIASRLLDLAMRHQSTADLEERIAALEQQQEVFDDEES